MIDIKGYLCVKLCSVNISETSPPTTHFLSLFDLPSSPATNSYIAYN